MIQTLFILFLSLPFFTGGSASWVLAENQDPTPTSLSLKSAFELSLKNNMAILLGRQKVEEKKSAELEKRSLFLPHLGFNLSETDATRNLKAQGVSFPGSPDKVGPFSTFDARLTFNETLLNLSQFNLYRASEEDTMAAEIELSQAESSLLYETGLLYFIALKAESAVQAEKANVDLSGELLNFARHQKEAGVATLLDITRAEVKLAQDRQKWISAVTQRDNAILAIQKQIGLRQGEAISFPDKNIPFKDLPDLQQAIRTALSNRKDLALQSQKAKVREIQFRSVADEKFPFISLFADYGEIGNGIADAFPTSTLGVSLGIPLYDGENRRAREYSLRSQISGENIKTRDLSLQIELEIRQIYNDLVSVKKQEEVAKERLSLAEKELRLAEDRFETGVSTHIELITTQTSLTEAREGLVEALYQVQAGILKYYYVTGQMGELLQRLP